MAFILVALGFITLAYLFIVVRQWRSTRELILDDVEEKPIVPVNLVDNDSAILVAEGRGRLIYVNNQARDWFGMNGDEPNLTTMAEAVKPADTFRDVFATEGRVSFRVGQRQVEASSHYIPADTGRRMVVVMRELKHGQVLEDGFDPVQAMTMVGEVSAMLAQSADLDETLHAILSSISTVIRFDASEINRWEEEQSLLRPIGRMGDPNYAAALQDHGGVYRLDEGYSGWLARYRQPIVIGDVISRKDVHPKVSDYAFHSFVGVPLMVGERFIGTLELASRQKQAFGYQDLNLLQSLSGQIAVAIENSRLYRDQSNRLAELSGLQQIAQSMGFLTEPSAMFGQINKSLAQLMRVDVAGVLLPNGTGKVLVGQMPMYGVQEPIAPLFKLAINQKSSPGYALWHHNEAWYTNTALNDSEISDMELDALVDMLRIRSLALVPMQVGVTVIGAVLVANPQDGHSFTDEDIRSLTVFAAEIAIVVENARLYKQEQRRAEELEGLQDIAQSVGLLSDPTEFYAQLTSRIANLMNVKMCGIWLYREVAHALVVHPPFYGAESDLLDNYLLPISDNDLVQRIWQEREYWFTNDLQHAVGRGTQLAHLAKELDIQKTIFALMHFGGQKIGVIQIANKQNEGDFDTEDAKVLSIFAGQAEVLIENARLYAETHQRAVESDNLRQIAESLAETIAIRDIAQQVLKATSSLLVCEAAGIGLLDTEIGKLVYEPTYFYGRDLPEATQMDMFSPGFVHSVALSRRSFISDDILQDDRVLPPYLEMGEKLGIRGAIIVPLVVQNRSIGELAAFNKKGGHFTDHDQALLNTVAAQIAASLERERLYEATDADLQAYVEELKTIDYIQQELAESLDLEHILEVTRSETARNTAADGVTMVLLSPTTEWLEPDKPILEKRLGGSRTFSRDKLAPIEQQALSKGVTIFLTDYRKSDYTALPEDARSAVVEPLLANGEPLGLIHIHSTSPNAFTEQHHDFLTRVGKQAVLALVNARRYRDQIRLNETLRGRTNQMTKVFSLGQMIRQGDALASVLGELAKTLAESIGYRQVIIRVVEDNKLEPIAQFGLSNRAFNKAREQVFTLETAEKMLHRRWEVSGEAYFYPVEYRDQWTKPVTKPLIPETKEKWQTGDLLIAPLYNSSLELLGWVSAEEPIDGRRPSSIIAESLGIFALEAAFSIENYRLIQNIRDEAAATRSDRDRLAMLHLVASDIQRAADMPTRLQAVVEGIHQVGWKKVRITMRDENLEHTSLIHTGYSEEEVRRLNTAILPGAVWRERLDDPEFKALRIGGAYYLRYDESWVKKNILRGEKPKPEQVDPDIWHPQDIVYLPLIGQLQHRILGIIGMEDPVDGKRPTEQTLQPIELFATQAAAAIENTYLYLESVRQKETEHRLSELMESVAATLDMESVMRTLAEGLQQMIAFTRMHVALPSGNEFYLRRVELTADGKVHLFDDEPVPIEGTAMAVAYQENSRLLYHLQNARDARDYIDLKRWHKQGERITLMVPMIAGGETLGVLRLGSELENAFGFLEHEDLVARMANLSAVAINHSRLLNDLRASTAYNEAVVESIQQGIIVLDVYHTITSVNEFIKQRYGWTDEAIGKNLYDYEPEFEVFLKHSVATALEEGIPQHQFEIQDFDSAGNRMIRNFYTYPLRQDDRITGVVLLVEDVTERAVLESNLAQRAEQLSALTRVSSRITSTLASDEVVSVVLEALESVMEYDGVTLWLRESGDRLRVLAARGFKDPGTASTQELIGLYVEIESSELFKEMAAQQKIINVGDTGAEDPRFPYGDQRVYKNWLGAPLIFQSEVVGVLALEKIEPYYYDTNHEQLLLAFANQASVALRNAQLFEQTTQRASELNAQARRLELLNRVAVALSQSLDIENIFEITLRETAIALNVEEAAAIKIDHEKELARVIVEYPRGDFEPEQVYSLSDHQIALRLRETLLPMVIDDLENDPLANLVKESLRRDDVKSVLFVPLVVGGTMIGMMRFDSNIEGRTFFSPERLEIAQTLASQGAIAVQNASLFEQSVMRTHELETLFEASQATAVTLDLNEAMRRVVGQMISALRADYCSIALWDDVENRLEIRQAVSAWGDASDTEPPGTVYDLIDFPAREQALRQREVMVLRPDRDMHTSEREVMERNGTKDRLLVPLVVNDYSIGLIDMEIREQNRFFDTGDIRLARTLASQSAVAIENARLQTETRSQIEELYIINDLSTAVSSKVNVDELYPMVRDQLPLLTDADILYLALYDPETKMIAFPVSVYSSGKAFEMPPRELGADEFSYVIKRRGPLLLAGSKSMEARVSYGIDTILPDAKSFLGVPMMAGDEVIGVLAVQDDSDLRAFGLNDQRILTTVASQLSVAIQNARLFEKTTELTEVLEKRVMERTSELDQERERVQALYDITTEAAASLDINRVLTRALSKVASAIGASSAVILGIDEVSEQLYVLHAFGDLEVRQEEERTPLRQDQGLAGWVLKNRQGTIIPDVQKDDRWVTADDESREKLRACVAALLEVGEDSRGVMMLFANKPDAFNDEHLKLVTAAASQLANSMNNAELYSLIRDQAERLGAILRKEQVESTKNTAILDSIADGVMYANEHGTVVLFNTSAERILGLPSARVTNRSITELTGLYGGSSGVWMDSMERWMNDPASHKDEDFVEELLELEDGRVVSVRLSPVNMGDQFLGTVSVFRDITKIVEVDRLKSEFVSTVSHELRTPMTSIKGYADLLLLGAAGEVSEAQQRFLETIKQNADRLSILVNDLLEVSRIDQDRVPLRFTRVLVPDLLESIAAHLHGRVEDQNRELEINVEVNGSLPAIRADYDRIIQIMQNLADNAFNYTPAHGKITLAAEMGKDKRSVLLSVKDTGVGIPKEIQDRIWERFFRGDEFDDMVLDTPGTGLGLSIVKSLVEMHDGEIWLESDVGKGSTFYVKMPVVQDQTASD